MKSDRPKFSVEAENARVAAGGPKFSTNCETEAAFRRTMELRQVELECFTSMCLFNQGNGKCGHIEPTISVRFDQTDKKKFYNHTVCWTMVARSVDGEHRQSTTD